MSEEFQSFITENRRLAILRFLAEDTDYSLNDSVLQTALEQIGFSMSRDAIRADLAFLKDVGVVDYDIVLKSVYVAKLTEKGFDVAKGRVVIPGIKRPAPR